MRGDGLIPPSDWERLDLAIAELKAAVWRELEPWLRRCVDRLARWLS